MTGLGWMLTAMLLALNGPPAGAVGPTDGEPTSAVMCVVDDGVPCALDATRMTASVKVDGLLDEADWSRASMASGFKQYEPVEGGEPSQRTEVRILYGENALYVGARLYDNAPGAILRTLGRRDDFNQADWFLVSIDSYLDRRTAYTFGVNAAGVQMDGLMTDEVDRSWDAVWQSAARVDAEGWAVEMRIPYSMLRFNAAEAQRWGINFQRMIPRTGETCEWVMVPRDERRSGVVARYGVLQNLRGIKPARTLQVTPYTVSSVRLEEGTGDGPTRTNALDVGGDVKVGITSNITLDATVNPDFGQVDADPAELNLTAFETFFPERRPFFVEGVQIFDYNFDMFGGDGSLLYTRRIGAAEPIIGATKLSGRTDGGLAFGVLSAATGADFAANRWYGVTRARQEINQDSYVGAMLTGYRHDADGVQSLAAGVDWDFRFRRNRYRLRGHASGTQRLLQGATGEQGIAADLRWDKLAGVWTYYTSLSMLDDQFNPSDVGRLRQRNLVRARAGGSYQVNGARAFGPFQRATARVFTWHDWSYSDGLYRGSNVWTRLSAVTQRFQRIELKTEHEDIVGGYDIFETRGLLAWENPGVTRVGVEGETDERRTWRARADVTLGQTTDGGRDVDAGLGFRWDASTRLSLSARLGTSWENGITAWSTNEAFRQTATGWQIGTVSNTAPADLAPNAYTPLGNGSTGPALLAPLQPQAGTDDYYVSIFGRRDTRTTDLSLRGNVVFTPTLSVQVFSQLFFARGRFRDFALHQNPETLAAFPDYPKRNDFAVGSLLSNIVLRWEYRPGSTLFVVWSQNRSSDEALDPLNRFGPSPFDQVPRDQVGGLFGEYPTNVFLVKLNYTFLR
ncbi:MAG: DUF5916 domain-containing protein [Bacteroidota bacterium]